MNRSGHVKLDIFDASGRLVRTLADMPFDTGNHILSWDGTDNAGHRLGAATYFSRLQVDGMTVGTERSVVLR